ncbi:PEP/pyruvate-binding domain-containing protein [Petroclostridium sp. X23]|uniref:PEP/pyruvate-binding domain-containing protein n=1 Tax=Petroclostridium sp. X23 TaxID=3045146 RepID=UPI0024ACD883|nr:PEP/pyruvate-binding domain-containing protein [Petroclostridium sp. X23]WHH60792.1 PEP/pyruvate-binding domain-containing protein [Petroclostridium sp. X23]
MAEAFPSKALEANLTQTHEMISEIPEVQKWFGELSKSKWGIYKRTQDFLIEFNHKYRSNQYVIESLHNICLEDLWFYNSLEHSKKALTVLIDIFKNLFESELEENQRELLIKTLVKFIDRLANLGSFPPSIISQCIEIIQKDMDQHELLYIRNSGYFKTYLNKVAQIPEFSPFLTDLTLNLLHKCIDYWDNTSKAEEWFYSKSHLFHSMDAKKIKDIGHPFFDHLRNKMKQVTDWEMLRHLMFYNDISNYFRSFTEKFSSSLETIYYLHFLLHLPGMSHLYDHLLYDMNRSLRSVFKELDREDITDFLYTMMSEFHELQKDHPGTVLDCILTLGKEVISTKDPASIAYFTKRLIKLGFNYPGKLSLNSDWQTKVNTNHVKNIRVWLELIEQDPFAMRELLAALIANLKLGGIFISDTDLFPRDVTKLLNSPIRPTYREIKQLARIFPIYFRDIGAEGKLREVTTAIDELSMRKDRMIHFLRKQIHTESNNTHIELTKKIIQYWYDNNREPLKDTIPDDIFEILDADNEWYIGVHEVLVKLCQKLNSNPNELMQLTVEKLKETLDNLSAGTNRDRSRVLYLFQIYSLILEKYSLESEDIISMMKNYNFFTGNDLSILKKDLESNHCEDAIRQIYKLMNHLKEIILDPKESEAFEKIYYKRHIAIGIPSMYGQYIEPKFEALGLMYRLERTVSKLMSRVVQLFNSEYITAKTFRHIYNVLVLFKEGLELDGIYNQGFNSHLDMLKYGLASPSFSVDQYINIFQFMARDIKQIIREYFFDVYERPLKVIIPQILGLTDPESEIENRQLYQMESEKFLRDNLSSAFLVQELDNFITDTIGTLRSMLDNYSHEFIESMLTYNPDLTFSLLSQKTEEVDNPVFLGAKAFFLKKLITYGFPVPPGFVITTEVFRHRGTINGHPYMRQDFDRMVKNNIADIERITGQRYGNANNPLFFSVRSGSSISLPGAMKSFLNVGMNDEIAEAFSRAKGFGWTAWDCYRRFLQSWGMAFGIDRDIFDQVMREHKERTGVKLKIQFSKEQMREIAFSYKKALEDHDIQIESDLFKQLKQAIRSVMNSWSSESAVYYRNHMQIASEWGTAVLVQKMILGNSSPRSGTGVVFTSRPFNGYSRVHLYGDFAICSQGEDVVSGLVNTLPISEYQRKHHYSDCSLSLESGFPQIYEALKRYAKQLIEQHGFVHQEIEFTFEADHPDSLYILQTRNQNLKKQKSYSGFIKSPNEMKLVGHGIGVSSGVLSGLLAFDMEDMEQLKKKNPDVKIILVRPDTVPDDMALIFVCDGLITAKGGVTSHAAVTAANLGKVCIVKCRGLNVKELEKKCTINGHTFMPGDHISIDGSLGNIYQGNYEIYHE